MQESNVENPNFDMIVNFVWNFEPERKYHICWIIHHYPLCWVQALRSWNGSWFCFVFFFDKLQFSASKIQLHKRGLRSSFGPLQNSFSFSNLQNKTMQNFTQSTQRQKQKYPRYWKRLWSSFGFQSSVVTLGRWQLIILRSGSEGKGRGDHF